MNRLALVLALAGCGFAQQHPAITAGIVAGAVGGLSCEMSDPAHQSTCGIITGGAAVFLGGVAALVTLIFDTSEHQLPPDEGLEDPDVIQTGTPPPPEPLPPDAGVDVPPPVDAAAVPADAP